MKHVHAVVAGVLLVGALLLMATGQIINGLYAILMAWISLTFMEVLFDYEERKKKGKPLFHLTALRNSIIAIDGILAILLFIVGLAFAVRLTMSNERKLEYDTYVLFRKLYTHPEKFKDGEVYIKKGKAYEPLRASMLDTLKSDVTLAFVSDENITQKALAELGIKNPIRTAEVVFFKKENGKVESFITLWAIDRDGNRRKFDYISVDGKAVRLETATKEEKVSFARKELKDLKKEC